MADPNDDEGRAAVISYLIRHIVLPSKLPQTDDRADENDICLLHLVLRALRDLEKKVAADQVACVRAAIASIQDLMQGRDTKGNVSQHHVQTLLQTLTEHSSNKAVFLEIKSQNAALIIRRDGQNILFESFELSPTNEAAMKKGRLIRHFPGLASTIPISKMRDEGLQSMLAATIATLIAQRVPGCQPEVQKAATDHVEPRDTAHPKMVTDYLMNIIKAIGATTDVPRITKHTREEVFWNKEQPWRRSPMWLLIRVALQSFFARQEGGSTSGSGKYKAFMILVLLHLQTEAKNVWERLGTESLHWITAKLHRRIHKFTAFESSGVLVDGWLSEVQKSAVLNHDFAVAKWRSIETCVDRSDADAALQTLRPENDSNLEIFDLNAFINGIKARKDGEKSTSSNLASSFVELPADELPTVFITLSDSVEQKHHCLAAFENWVEHNQHSYTKKHKHEARICTQLRALVEHYPKVAKKAYAGVPSSLSVMTLTSVELWIMLDKVACHDSPWQEKFDPEINLDQLYGLLLPHRSQMRRLFDAEHYVKTRRDTCDKHHPSVYGSFGAPTSFPVEYFNTCKPMQEQKADIEQDATQERQKKRQEWNDKCRLFQELRQRANTIPCTCKNTNPVAGEQEQCEHCKVMAKADAMECEIHEWPLSSNPDIAKTVVFELNPPEVYSEWRDATFYLITEVLGFTYVDPRKPHHKYGLASQKGLPKPSSMKFFGERRIIPMSEIKAHSTTLYNVKVSVAIHDEESVFPKNALVYRYYDRGQLLWCTKLDASEHFSKSFSHALPERASVLERFMYRPPCASDGLASNETIASIDDCPTHFSLAEFGACATMPLGRDIVYHNILAQLAMPSIDLAKQETQSLVQQVIHEAGPSNGGVVRNDHSILTDHSFAKAMLQQLVRAHERYCLNWDSWRAVAILIHLARRVMSLTDHSDHIAHSLSLLDAFRQTCVSWQDLIQRRLIDATSSEQRTDLYTRLVEIALLCCTTFDVEDRHIEDILKQPDAIMILLRSSIIVQENWQSSYHAFECSHKIMLQDWRRLSVRIFSRLRQLLLRDSGDLDRAVSASWIGFIFPPKPNWKPHHKDWLTTISNTSQVDYNILTGELLIKGAPLARLPEQYAQHPLYRKIFQTAILDVGPADEPGMRFSTKLAYHGHKLNFGMSNGDMLLVAKQGESRLDFIPPRLFHGRLPSALFEDYVHWYDRSSDEVIFRSINQPWVAAKEQWRLGRQGQGWRLVKGSRVLIEPSSRSARAVCEAFLPLEDQNYIHITLDALSHAVNIALPRLRLDFSIAQNSTQIQSCQYRGWFVDADQTIGTLIGLTSKLVLRNEQHERQFVIPVPRNYIHAYSIKCSKGSEPDQISVEINRDETDRIYKYQLDSFTHRIVDNGELQAKLLLCYLHALTSGCFPDPFTGLTGAESALNTLTSAAVKSFEVLGSGELGLLALLAKLSPIRKFYPPHEKVIQQVSWEDGVPIVSQQGEFAEEVRSILAHAQRQQIFYPHNEFKSLLEEESWRPSVRFLEERETLRAANFQVHGFGAEKYTRRHDTIYEARDSDVGSSSGQKALTAANFILRDNVALFTKVPDLKAEIMSSSFGKQVVQGTNKDFQLTSLRFEIKWMQDFSVVIAENFCSIHRCLSNSASELKKYDIMAWLSTMAYAASANMHVVQALGMMYKAHTAYAMQVPSAATMQPALGEKWNASQLKACIRPAILVKAKKSKAGDKSTPARKLDGHGQREPLDRKESKAIADFVKEAKTRLKQRKTSLSFPASITMYLDTAKAMKLVQEQQKVWQENAKVFAYLDEMTQRLQRAKAYTMSIVPFKWLAPAAGNQLSDTERYLGGRKIFDAQAPIMSYSGGLFEPEEEVQQFTKPVEPRIVVQKEPSRAHQNSRTTIDTLIRTLSVMTRGKAVSESNYVDLLMDSYDALETLGSERDALVAAIDNTTTQQLQHYRQTCERYLSSLEEAMLQAIKDDKKTDYGFTYRMGHAPRINPSFWLKHLNRKSFEQMPASWKDVIIEYGLAITQLHRAERLLELSEKPSELARELEHTGHINWNPYDDPEALLREVEGGIMIRHKQMELANYMRAPPEGENVVVQLNMGEGKSSTIVPLVAGHHANGTKLVRVVVSRAQRTPMGQTLISVFGGLQDRPIYYTPFSREHRPSAEEAAVCISTWEECMASGGILLIQPEDILSFKLMGVECLLTGRHDVAKILLRGQAFLDKHAIDIIDEVDEQLSVKSEVVYTMGCQKLVEFSPDRAVVHQDVLALLSNIAGVVKAREPNAIELHDVSERFPMLRVLSQEGEVTLMDLLARNVVNSRLFPHVSCPATKEALFRYITVAEVAQDDIATVECSSLWVHSVKEKILIVRGLIAGGLLGSVLRTKRWRVNYGNDDSRSPPTSLAVPYRSKDDPAARSDYSHPDILIVLTLLSQYYRGLTNEQLFDTFDHVFQSGHPDVHFNEWVDTASPRLPAHFRQLSGVAIRDKILCTEEIFPHFRHSRHCVNYFLNNLVFPKQLKEFQSKLSASGWDLGSKKVHPTVGFSGTNDTRPLLPLSVKQVDLESQLHTNAMVLDLLLQDGKASVDCMTPRTDGTDAEHVLTAVTKIEPEIRVLIDCGATIMELNNKQIAEAWLHMKQCDEIEAAVYWDDEGTWVLDRTGHVEGLQSSPYAQKLDVCLVYFDQSRSRGTDIKLPSHYRAGVTLGSGLTKDALVQGCMRMRKLVGGQSVTFILPEEISMKIRKQLKIRPRLSISPQDVLVWTILEMWSHLRKSVPAWAVQGNRYESNRKFLRGEQTTEQHAEAMLESDSKSLEDRYRPKIQDIDGEKLRKSWDMENDNITRIVKQCEAFRTLGFFDEDDLEEEQEREIAPEKEEQRQAERGQKVEAAEHNVHADVHDLIMHGTLRPTHTTFRPAFQSLQTTSAADLLYPAQFPTDLLVTADFERTIKKPAVSKEGSYITDSFLRPVQHVLSVMSTTQPSVVQNLIVISPHEANKLKRYVIGSRKVTLHTFMPRIHESYAPLDRLTLYNVGRDFDPSTLSASLRAQLNLFAGSLYLSSFEEYTEMCDFLGLARPGLDLFEDQQISSDGFISPPTSTWGLQKTPVPFLKALLLRMRHKGDGLEKTHLGKMLNGIQLEQSDFRLDVNMADDDDMLPEESGDPMDMGEDYEEYFDEI